MYLSVFNEQTKVAPTKTLQIAANKTEPHPVDVDEILDRLQTVSLHGNRLRHNVCNELPVPKIWNICKCMTTAATLPTTAIRQNSHRRHRRSSSCCCCITASPEALTSSSSCRRAAAHRQKQMTGCRVHQMAPRSLPVTSYDWFRFVTCQDSFDEVTRKHLWISSSLRNGLFPLRRNSKFVLFWNKNNNALEL